MQKLFGLTPPGKPMTIDPSQLIEPWKVKTPYPVIDDGIVPIIQQARGWYLLAAVLVFPTTFVLVSYRWAMLLRLLDISISNSRTFVLTMVGLFYNNFMPGSTGGDLIKAYYAAKNTPKRTAVVLSVLIDRVIGLLALIVLGGSMAALQWDVEQCRKIAIGCAAILGLTAGGLAVFYVPMLRKLTGFDLIVSKLPMQRQVQNAIKTMELYGHHPWKMLWALVITLPVHATVVISAYLAGKAFGLPLSAGYYWVVVPVIVLSGAIPISPQGAGVMEFFAILLTHRQGATVTHAFLLTMSIRLVQMLWNLSGAIFVFRGGYEAPHDRCKRIWRSSKTHPARPMSRPSRQTLPPVAAKQRQSSVRRDRTERVRVTAVRSRAVSSASLQMLKKIDRILLRVPAVAAAAKYYADTFGLEPIKIDQRIASFRIGDAELLLHNDPDLPAEGVYYLVDNVRELYTKRKELNLTFISPPAAASRGWRATVRDPFGLVLLLLDRTGDASTTFEDAKVTGTLFAGVPAKIPVRKELLASLYEQTGRTADDLPYTPHFETMVKQYAARLQAEGETRPSHPRRGLAAPPEPSKSPASSPSSAKPARSRRRSPPTTASI